MDVSVDQLHRAVEGQHGGTAVLVAAGPVKEVQAQTLWEDVAHVVELEGHPKATSAKPSLPRQVDDHGRLSPPPARRCAPLILQRSREKFDFQ